MTLVEKVARAIAHADQDGMTDLVVYEDYHQLARAAIRIVIEEAARVAEELVPVTPIGYHDTHANNIAAAIRALAKEW